ncbi:uncharacterized protein B0I36DRAFT_318569 [Microdochium trichocladiopsis]|uniref:Uncharacterized protein n=1 Tax=Microdochium trichocladiopsis TaxID=1682393 RepID=A0A9P8YCR0_9PEZI|nr:uncharacterized protein B0I36DRAFT_318569 [Microdochium trichocladiopsis]KAH7035545.1 hypothetical protein B0I36DRAFT_318569 [Microdochium trichocladiopsis]
MLAAFVSLGQAYKVCRVSRQACQRGPWFVRPKPPPFVSCLGTGRGKCLQAVDVPSTEGQRPQTWWAALWSRGSSLDRGWGLTPMPEAGHLQRLPDRRR